MEKKRKNKIDIFVAGLQKVRRISRVVSQYKIEDDLYEFHCASCFTCMLLYPMYRPPF